MFYLMASHRLNWRSMFVIGGENAIEVCIQIVNNVRDVRTKRSRSKTHILGLEFNFEFVFGSKLLPRFGWQWFSKDRSWRLHKLTPGDKGAKVVDKIDVRRTNLGKSQQNRFLARIRWQRFIDFEFQPVHSQGVMTWRVESWRGKKYNFQISKFPDLLTVIGFANRLGVV